MEPAFSKKLDQEKKDQELQETSESCANCYFARRNPKNFQEITCRERSIHPLVLPSVTGLIEIKGYWPPVEPGLWCGKWRPRWKVEN